MNKNGGNGGEEASKKGSIDDSDRLSMVSSGASTSLNFSKRIAKREPRRSSF